jgi:hypothetical protein
VALDFIAVVLRVALIGTFIGVGWRLYHRLPPDPASILGREAGEQPRDVEVKILLRRGPEEGAVSAGVPVEIYELDAVRANRGAAPGDSPSKAPRKKPPLVAPAVKVRLDEDGQAVVQLRPGRWWLRASLSGARNLTWQLPVDVFGPPLTVELTPENAYTREKSF